MHNNEADITHCHNKDKMLQNKTLFKNFSTKDFKYPWAGKEYTFKAGSVTPMEQAEFLHFQKHLVDRELNESEPPVRTNDLNARAELEVKCVVAEEPEVPNEKTQAPPKEEEFEGLKE